MGRTRCRNNTLLELRHGPRRGASNDAGIGEDEAGWPAGQSSHGRARPSQRRRKKRSTGKRTRSGRKGGPRVAIARRGASRHMDARAAGRPHHCSYCVWTDQRGCRDQQLVSSTPLSALSQSHGGSPKHPGTVGQLALQNAGKAGPRHASNPTAARQRSNARGEASGRGARQGNDRHQPSGAVFKDAFVPWDGTVPRGPGFGGWTVGSLHGVLLMLEWQRQQMDAGGSDLFCASPGSCSTPP